MSKDKDKKFKLHDDVKEFAKTSLKKFKKREGDFYSKKKDLKEAYYSYMTELLPETIYFLIRHGHIPENKETKEAVLMNFNDPGFTKYLIDAIKDEVEIKNIEMVPAIINDILIEYATLEDKSGEQYDVADLVKLSKLILKKKLKKMEKSDIPDDVAFDVLSIIPDTKVINKNPFFRMRSFMQALYVTAAKKKIDAEMFGKIVNIVFKDDDNQYDNLMLYVMRERKSDFDNLKEEGQKTFWVETKKWLVEALGDMKKKDIEELLNIYIDARKADAKMQKDVERKFNFIKDADVTFGEKLTEVIEKLSKDEDKKKFLS